MRLPDEAIYVPLGHKGPIGKPAWESMLSVVDEGLTSIPWEDLDLTLVQAIQRESDGLAFPTCSFGSGTSHSGFTRFNPVELGRGTVEPLNRG